MQFIRNSVFILPLFLLTPALLAQAPPDPHEECEKRIRVLEDRLRRVEGQLAILMGESSEGQHALVTSAAQPVDAAAPVVSERRSFEMPPELVPEIGKIGAEVGLLVSGSASPFKLDPGAFYGGFIDLPLIDRPSWLHGKISYEILVGLSRSKTQVQSTSNVAQVANLAVLNTLNPNGGLTNLTQAVTGTGSAPFPVTTTNQANMRLLQVIPFAFKYTSTVFDRWRLRPYAVAGLGTYVTIHSESPLGSGVRPDADVPPAILSTVQQLFGGKSPFGAPLVAGQIAQSSELIARGLPGGNGSIDIGGQFGGGFELRLTRTLSLGFDSRFNKISGANATFATYGSRIGFHF